MVDGCPQIVSHETPLTMQPCAVVDLDGTLLRGNSLRMMIRFLATKFWREGRFGRLAEIALLLAARRLRLISHVRMKQPLHTMASVHLSPDEIEDFVGQLSKNINSPLLTRLVAFRRQGYRLILATAAPALYIPALARMLGTSVTSSAHKPSPRSTVASEDRLAAASGSGATADSSETPTFDSLATLGPQDSALVFDALIATPLSAAPADYREARGERKLTLCLDRAAEDGWQIRAVITDHADDLPLLRLPGIHRLLVNPAPSLLQTLTTLHLPFKEIRTDSK